jgi:hypothetical protein
MQPLLSQFFFFVENKIMGRLPHYLLSFPYDPKHITFGAKMELKHTYTLCMELSQRLLTWRLCERLKL